MDRDRTKKILMVSFTGNYYLLQKRQLNRKGLINDLSIEKTLKREYTFDDIYPTLYAYPPSNYRGYLSRFDFDENGVPLNSQGKYNPVAISNYGLAEYGYYKSTHVNKHLEHARVACNWFLNNQDQDTGYWLYHFPYKHIYTDCTLKDWPSAMAQGQATSLLCRMYCIDQEESYLDVARKAFKMFLVPIEKGGLCAEYNGYLVFEEYPTIPASFTLNGLIYASLGLYDYLCIKNDCEIDQLWKIALKTIEYMLPLYDGDIISSYDLSHITSRKKPRSYNEKYHIIHILLLQCLNGISQNDTFEYYIRKWAAMCGIKIT